MNLRVVTVCSDVTSGFYFGDGNGSLFLQRQSRDKVYDSLCNSEVFLLETLVETPFCPFHASTLLGCHGCWQQANRETCNSKIG
jgi:hypothetical protein